MASRALDDAARRVDAAGCGGTRLPLALPRRLGVDGPAQAPRSAGRCN
ncbi:MAG: hypothetical protein KIT17_03655 [Rubrivivax sp.]|nr:hypothetical protein [Rubrivivax sp.]